MDNSKAPRKDFRFWVRQYYFHQLYFLLYLDNVKELLYLDNVKELLYLDNVKKQNPLVHPVHPVHHSHSPPKQVIPLINKDFLVSDNFSFRIPKFHTKGFLHMIQNLKICK